MVVSIRRSVSRPNSWNTLSAASLKQTIRTGHSSCLYLALNLFNFFPTRLLPLALNSYSK